MAATNEQPSCSAPGACIACAGERDPLPSPRLVVDEVGTFGAPGEQSDLVRRVIAELCSAGREQCPARPRAARLKRQYASLEELSATLGGSAGQEGAWIMTTEVVTSGVPVLPRVPR